MKYLQNKYLPFLIGFLNFISFNSVGQLILVEIFAFLLFLIIKVLFMYKSKNRLDKEIRYIFILGILWLIGSMLSDYNAHSEKIDTAKSVAQVLVLLVLLYWVYTWLIEETDRLTFYIWGYSLSSLGRYFLMPAIFDHSDPWKFVFGPNLTILFLLIIGRLKTPIYVKQSLIVVLVFLDLFLGSRSLAIITLLTLLTYRVKPFVKGRLVGTLSLLVVAMLSLYLFNFLYVSLAKSGELGRTQQIKYYQQSQAGPVALTGRSELLYELTAIGETRFLGLGSNPSITNDFLDKIAAEESRFGVRHNSTTAYLGYISDGKIPEHSMIFTAWLEGGVLAALFWFYLFSLVFRWILRFGTDSQPFGLLSKYLSINFFWALCFSPLGAGSRVILAFSLGIIFFQSKFQSK
jgi:hypothetical protein